MEQIIFFVFIAAFGIINALIKKANENKKPPSPIRRNSDSVTHPFQPSQQERTASSEEERIRKFMEALGLPVDAPPPAPSPVIQKTPVSTPSPLVTEARRQRTTVQPERGQYSSIKRAASGSSIQPTKKPEVLSAAESAALQNIKQGKVSWAKSGSTVTQDSHIPFHALLQNRKGLQQAILLKEILDEPLGLRSLV